MISYKLEADIPRCSCDGHAHELNIMFRDTELEAQQVTICARCGNTGLRLDKIRAERYPIIEALARVHEGRN